MLGGLLLASRKRKERWAKQPPMGREILLKGELSGSKWQ